MAHLGLVAIYRHAQAACKQYGGFGHMLLALVNQFVAVIAREFHRHAVVLPCVFEIQNLPARRIHAPAIGFVPR